MDHVEQPPSGRRRLGDWLEATRPYRGKRAEWQVQNESAFQRRALIAPGILIGLLLGQHLTRNMSGAGGLVASMAITVGGLVLWFIALELLTVVLRSGPTRRR